MGSTANRNSVVSLLRVTGMLMIVACHIFTWLGMTLLGQLFNVGVEIFLLISGIIYSQKRIDNGLLFIKQRWIKICTSYYIWILILLPINYFNGESSSITSIVAYLFDLQGINSLLINIQSPIITGAGHLWFLTVIMICYLLLIPIKRCIDESFWSSRKAVVIGLVILALDLVLICIGIQIGYILCYFIGYAIGKWRKTLSKKTYVFITTVMIASVMLRFFSNKYYDNTIVYNYGVSILTHIALAVWIYSTAVVFYGHFPNLVDRLTSCSVWNYLEKYSFCIYICHYAFLTGPLNVGAINTNIGIQMILFFVFVTLSSYSVKRFSDSLTKLLNV